MSKNGSPPQDTRFKKGQSGNPKGRPKGALNFRTVVQKMMRENITITEGGRKKKITKAEALARTWMRRAFEGDMRAIQLLAAFQERNDPVDDPHANQPIGKSDLRSSRAFSSEN